jgi:predicted RNase H-like nuclease (RuvC/YqgF family)
MVLNYLLDNLLPLAIAVGGGIAWILDKQKRKAELESVKISNEQSKALNKQNEAGALAGMQEEYAKFVEVVRKEIAELREENTALKSRVKDLEKELKASANERTQLSEQLGEFKVQAEKDAKLIRELNTKIQNYEKEMKVFRKERK